MFAQAGSQFRDELQRHDLPSSLVNIKPKIDFIIVKYFIHFYIHFTSVVRHLKDLLNFTSTTVEF